MCIKLIACAIKKHLKLLFLLPILLMISTLLINLYCIKPTYKSTILIYIGDTVNGSEENNSEFLMYKELVDTYGKIATSRIVARNVLQETNLNISEDDLLSSISYKAVQSTQFLELSIKCKNKDDVALIANALPNSLKKTCSEIHDENLDNIAYMDSPTEPTTDFNLKIILYLIVSFLLGIFISFGIIIFEEYINNTIKNESTLSKLLSIPNIITLPVLKK